MKSHTAFASGDISKASNVGAVLIRFIPFLKQRRGRLRSNALPARTPGETSQKIGIPPEMQAGLCPALTPTNHGSPFFPSWLYAQFITVDANFRLKLKDRQINDPELGSGWAYFVENSAYTHHVKENLYEEEACRIPSEVVGVLIAVLGHELRK